MFNKEIYRKRRDNLRRKVGNGLVFLLGNNDSPANYQDNAYRFRQDSTFLYFFGHSHPGLAGVIDADMGEDMLCGTDVDMDDIIWMGPQPTIGDKAVSVGVEKSGTLADLKSVVCSAIRQGRRVHFLPQYRHDNQVWLKELTGIRHCEQQNYVSQVLIDAVVSLRSKKECCEIEELDLACNIGYEMHTTAMRMCKEGVHEQFIAGAIDGIALAYGSMVSFPTILSQHGEILHNHGHEGVLQRGRMMLTDAGVERMSSYCSDHTRTVPVGGKFDSRQRDIYTAVLDCHDHALALARPGVTYKDVHLSVCKVLAQHLKALGLMKGNVDDAVAAGAHALFLPHGLGHMLGLDVHDMENLGQVNVGYDSEVRPSSQFGLASLRMGRKLESGFVVTDEPGCYFIPALIDKWKAEKMHADFLNYDVIEIYKDFGGIRLEDDILITDEGSRFLGEKRIPITIDEVETFMNNQNK